MKQFPYNNINVLIMPTDYCNLNCIYCFNSHKTCMANNSITMDTVQKVFSTTIPYYDELRFIWHGGEPTSMGLPFYRDIVALQKSINRRGSIILNSIQTNLTLMDENLAMFFVENSFHIGSSFDGTQNERTRYDSSKILSGRDLVIRHGGKVGFICVVQSTNVDHLIEDYIWFKQRSINYTLNMYISPPPYEKDILFVPPAHYSQRICELFDCWLLDRECNIHISYFDDFVDYMLFCQKSLCCYNSCMGKHIGVHFDGTISGCNRDFPAEYNYGNIRDYSDIRECFESEGFHDMLQKAIARRKQCKETCELFGFCAGGCNSCALMGGDLASPNTYVCQTLTAIYHHIEQQIDRWKNQPASEIRQHVNPYLKGKLMEYQDCTTKHLV